MRTVYILFKDTPWPESITMPKPNRSPKQGFAKEMEKDLISILNEVTAEFFQTFSVPVPVFDPCLDNNHPLG